MAKNVDQIESEFINRVGKITKQWGMGEPAGRIWAAMLFSHKSLSQKELSERTGYTLSLVSPSLKILESHNIARPIKNGREKCYELTGSFTEAFSGMVYRLMEHDIKPLVEQLEKAKISGEEKKKQVDHLTREYRDFEGCLRTFIKILDMRKAALTKIKRLQIARG